MVDSSGARSSGDDSSKAGSFAALKRGGSLLFKGVVATAGAVSVVAAALYILFPGAIPRQKLGAELDRVVVQQGVSLSRYNAEMGRTATKDEVDTPGIVVLVHAKLLGFEDRGYVANVFALDAETHQDLFPPNDVPAAICGIKSPEADEDAVAWRCWLIAPPSGKKFMVRVELTDLGPQDLSLIHI